MLRFVQWGLLLAALMMHVAAVFLAIVSECELCPLRVGVLFCALRVAGCCFFAWTACCCCLLLCCVQCMLLLRRVCCVLVALIC